MIEGGAGADTLNGGSGTDTASYADKSSAVTATVNGANSDSDTLAGFENLTGGSLPARPDEQDGSANTIKGGAGNDTIEGRGGADNLDGEGNTDTVSYADRSLAVTATINGSNSDSGTLSNFENLTGGSGFLVERLTAIGAIPSEGSVRAKRFLPPRPRPPRIAATAPDRRGDTP